MSRQPLLQRTATPFAFSLTGLPFTFAIFLSSVVFADGLPRAKPESVGMRDDRLARISDVVAEGLSKKKMPGCVVTIGRRGRIVYQKAFGFRQLEPDRVPMTVDTVFDLASLTKPIATATSAMILFERGDLRMRDRVSEYVPSFANSGKEAATIEDLLTHQAGLIPDNALADYRDGRAAAFQNIYALKAMYPPQSRFVYSDVGFVLLDDIIERVSGSNVDQFSKRHLFAPLGMHETGFLPPETLRARAAATERRDGHWMKGEVHDPRAFAMGGVAGHAGLFSTSNDLAIYAQMMLQGGEYGGNRILSRATVDLMTSPRRIVEGQKVSLRGLGWDKRTGYSSNRGENMSPRAYGHGGFTGTVLWIDPEHDLFFLFLSNRVHPAGKGSVNRLAGRIATIAISSIDD
ncbi:MAG: serine hydrolase domain-containing protein [Planctomycetota bacterium]